MKNCMLSNDCTAFLNLFPFDFDLFVFFSFIPSSRASFYQFYNPQSCYFRCPLYPPCLSVIFNFRSFVFFFFHLITISVLKSIIFFHSFFSSPTSGVIFLLLFFLSLDIFFVSGPSRSRLSL